MDISREELGKRLELLRTIRGRTQEAFGQPINMNRDAVCRVERGKRDILALELVRLARHYCFRIDPLLEVRADGTWDITACLLPYRDPGLEATEE
ncbi:MAG: helix-turn-helix transcriptional regulator [Flavobacteriales bacterium]